MKRSDLWWLALKGWKRIMFPGIFFLVLAVYLLGMSSTILWTLSQEKSAPCRLVAEAGTGSGTDLTKLSQISGVTAYTAVYEVPVSVTAGAYTADLTLYGIDSDFLDEGLKEGSVYPEETVMPYLLVNEPALKLFQDSAGQPVQEPDSVDWLNSGVTIEGAPPVVSKICGILKSEADEDSPSAYISQTSAKALLAQRGETASGKIWIALQNSGYEESVEKALSALGYTVENADREREERWTLSETKGLSLCLAGVIALLAAFTVLLLRIKEDAMQHELEYRHLQKLCGGPVQKRLSLIRVIAVTLLAGLIGTALLVLTQSFNQALL